MPQRFLRPGIRTSERWNSISRDGQALYLAILTLVDDYGRYDARASVLCAEAFGVWNAMNPEQAVSLKSTETIISQLCERKLVEIYESEGKKFLQVTQWQERTRGKSRWPDPVDCKPQHSAASCGEMLPPSSLASDISHKPSPDAPRVAAEVCEYERNGSNTKKPKFTFSFDEMKSALSALYSRPKDDPLAYTDQQAIAEICRRPHAAEELVLVKKYFSSVPQNSKNYLPNSLGRLVSAWPDVVDRSRKYKAPTGF